MFKKSSLIAVIILLGACSSSELYINKEDIDSLSLSPPANEEMIYRVFLIGDVGASTPERPKPTLRLLQSYLDDADEHSAVIFLGDNIYPTGLPDSSNPDRQHYEQQLIQQLKTVEQYPGRVVFIPGNHDWDNGGKDGLEAVKRQERFVEEYLGRGNTFLPDDGYPGPVSIKLMDDDEHPQLPEDIRLLVLDTQWWLHQFEKPYGDTGDYELFDAGDVLIELDDILKKQRKDYLLIAAHHPLITHDNHGGYLPPSTHLKPPVIGSVYAIYRRVFGFKQDLNHHRYSQMTQTLREFFTRYELEDMIYASGHSHGMQYHKDEGPRITHHYVVSGGGSKKSYIARGRGAEFTYSGKGFITIQYYTDGSVWMEAWTPDGDGSQGTLVYRNRLKAPHNVPFPDDIIPETIPDIDFTDSTRTVAANPDYDGKGRLFEWIVGKHNRKYWSVKNEFPVFDITDVEGGLVPVRLGGKGQSTTLHLERDDRRDYVLRTVDKEAGRIWSDELRKTIALDVAQDQFSIINPYAALIIPTLEDAIGVYHTNPKIYYVPHDPRLGVYQDDISGELALFEERPNGDMSDVESVGYSEEVISHTELIRELDNDIDHRVDQEAFVRARLLDMLLSDWDRHSDQWRWASFQPDDEKGKIYVPVPRDRDVALMRMTGLLPTLAKVMGPFFQYQNFSEGYGNLKGLNNNSLSLTRRFTNQITKEEWLDIAGDIERSLTDDVIEQAVRNYPGPVFEKYGDETLQTLKARRDQLTEIAGRYYDLISGVVSIPGSNKRELFDIEILSDDEINVRVLKLSKKGEEREQYFERTFRADETDELRLYGMGGDDRFRLRGVASNSTKIRVTGGAGDDEYQDETSKRGLRSTVFIYETERGNQIEAGSNTKVKRANIPANVIYNYNSDFRWNSTLAGLYFEYNSKDGLFLGGGPDIIRYGFRKQPASRHFARANYAPSTGAANIRYNGTWYQIAGNWRAEFQGHLLFPKSYKNFFGLGNETTLEDRSINYYRARLYQYLLEPRMAVQKDIMDFYAGVRVQATNVERDPFNIVSDPVRGISPDDFREQWFGGLVTGLKFNDLDDGRNPRQGYRFFVDGDLNFGFVNTSENFSRIQSELELYISPRLNPQVTIANRTGTAHNIGDFPFYESNSLGGTINLRGYNGRRFSGRTILFNNTEIRLELFDFYRYLLGGRVGITGFFDTGRVWADNQSSDVWHTGYGGGVWFHLFNSFLINSDIGISEEGTLFTVKAGFLF